MFNQKSKNSGREQSVPAGSASIIASGTTFSGDINSDCDIRIDGTVKGNIQCRAKLVIGANGVVEGDIQGQQADIMGRVTGSVSVTELLQLKGGCQVEGNLLSGQLQIEPSAKFNGQCQMSQEQVDTGKNAKKPRDIAEPVVAQRLAAG